MLDEVHNTERVGTAARQTGIEVDAGLLVVTRNFLNETLM
jgi:hypothetical protein